MKVSCPAGYGPVEFGSLCPISGKERCVDCEQWRSNEPAKLAHDLTQAIREGILSALKKKG